MDSKECFSFVTRSVEETLNIASKVSKYIVGGEIIGLTGPLGAGKTYFVKGLASGLDIDPSQVKSPTFAIMRRHVGQRFSLYHLDAYRIKSGAEFLDIGVDDFLGQNDGITAIEWADRVREALPSEILEVSIAYHDGDRIIEVSGKGRYLDIIKGLCKEIGDKI